MHQLLIQEELIAQGIQSAQFFGTTTKNKILELKRFKEDPAVSVLLLDKSGAVGLDLSFVSDVFLMEPIYDRALEAQIIARAWRMGATSTVTVHRLAMRGSVEEMMLKGENSAWKEGGDGDEDEGVVRKVREEDDATKRATILKYCKRVVPERLMQRSNNISTSSGSSSSSSNSNGSSSSNRSSGPSSSSSSSSSNRANINTFIPAPHFEGQRFGYFFSLGNRGLGYYIDNIQRNARPQKRQRME